MKKLRKKSVENALKQMEEIYFKLVYKTENLNFLLNLKNKISNNDYLKKHITEIINADVFLDYENGIVNPGFNAGVLAGIRYAICLMESDKDSADTTFPHVRQVLFTPFNVVQTTFKD